MLSVKDFKPKPYELDREDFRVLPEVCKQEIALTHPECVVRFSNPYIIRLSNIATANERDWFIPTSAVEQLDEVE